METNENKPVVTPIANEREIKWKKTAAEYYLKIAKAFIIPGIIIFSYYAVRQYEKIKIKTELDTIYAKEYTHYKEKKEMYERFLYLMNGLPQEEYNGEVDPPSYMNKSDFENISANNRWIAPKESNYFKNHSLVERLNNIEQKDCAIANEMNTIKRDLEKETDYSRKPINTQLQQIEEITIGELVSELVGGTLLFGSIIPLGIGLTLYISYKRLVKK